MTRFDTRDPFRIVSKLGIEIMYTDALKRLKGMYRVQLDIFLKVYLLIGVFLIIISHNILIFNDLL